MPVVCLSGKFADEVLNETATEVDFVHVVGHFDFLAAILEPLPAAKRSVARRVLERYELLSSPWSQVIGEMAKLGLSRKGLDEIAALDICGALRTLRGHLPVGY